MDFLWSAFFIGKKGDLKLEIIKRSNKYGKTVYKIKKAGKYAAIILHEFEIDLLEQLVKFISIPSNNVIDYFVELRALNGFDTGDDLRNRNNASNRLITLKRAGLVRSKVPNLLGAPFLYKLNIYTFSVRTLDLLLQLNRLDEQQLAYYLAVLKKTSAHHVPSPHHVAISILGTKLDILLKKAGLDNDDYIISRGSVYPLFKNTKQTSYTIYPDLVLYFPDFKKCIAFEIDGGKQQKDIIADKYKRYKQLAKRMEDNQTLHVVFVPIDNNLIPDIGISLKSKRIKHLKKCIPSSKEWPKNLHLFALNSFAVMDYVGSMLICSELFSNYTAKSALKSWCSYFEKALKESNSTLKTLESNASVPQIAFEYILITIKKQNEMPINYLVLYMNTGSIADHQNYLKVYQTLLEQNSSRFNLILLYKSKKSRELDTLEIAKTNNSFQIVATSLNEWQDKGRQKHIESLPFYKQNRKTLNFDLLYDNIQLS